MKRVHASIMAAVRATLIVVALLGIKMPAFGTTGDCYQRARSIDVLHTYEVTLVDEYDAETGWYQDAGIHMLRFNASSNGGDYTIVVEKVDTGSDISVDVHDSTYYDIESEAALPRFSAWTTSTDGMTFSSKLSEESWYDSDVEKGVYYICVSGEIGDRVCVSVFATSETAKWTDGDGVTWTYGWQEGGLFIRAVEVNGNVNVSIPSAINGVDVAGINGELACPGVKCISIPSGVTNICDSAFKDCPDVESYDVDSENSAYKSDDGMMLSKDGFVLHAGVNGINGSVAIPDGVTDVVDYAFYGRKNLTSVSVPASVSYMASNAFSGCDKLKAFSVDANNESYKSVSGLLLSPDGSSLERGVNGAVKIPGGVTEICDWAFEGLGGLVSVEMPDGTTSIGCGAFSGCRNLNEVLFPTSVVTIASKAFFGCRGLKLLNIPDSVTEIWDGAFMGCSGLKQVNLPEHLAQIDVNTFRGCISLTEIDMPNGVWCVSDGAFCGCSSLKTVSIPEGVSQIGSEAFAECVSLSAISMPNNMETIGWGAFYNCRSLTNVTLPNGIECIDGEVFRGCSKLQSVSIPAGVQSIGWCAFYDCSQLESITLPAGLISIFGEAFNGCQRLASATIPSGVTYVGENAFARCHRLTSMNIPASVTSVGFDAFGQCYNLLEFTVENDNQVYSAFDGILYNKNRSVLIAFPCGKTDSSFTLLSSVSEIYDYAFSGCTNLETVVLHDGMNIGEGAFCGCSRLSNVVMPTDIVCIPARMFEGCVSLTSVDFALTANVNSIEHYAFHGCHGLTDVTIPAQIIDIGTGAFSGCRGLKSINVANGSEYYCSYGGVLFDSSLTTLIAFPGGKSTEYRIPSGTETIGAAAFAGCDNLESATLPSSLKTIEGFAFGDCSRLIDLEIPEGVVKICGMAFKGCNGISAMDVGMVVDVQDELFADCRGLKTLTLPGSVINYDYNYVTGCDHLMELRLRGVLDYGWNYDCEEMFWQNSPWLSGHIDKVDYEDRDVVITLRPELPIVTFEPQGGECVESYRMVEANAAVGALPAPTRLHYAFTGWYTAAIGGTKVSSSTVVTESVTYHARWKYDGKVLVSAAAEDPTQGTVSGGNARYAIGTKVTLKASAKKTYRFIGWYDGDERVSTKASYSFTTKDADVALVAKFEYDELELAEIDDFECDKGEKFEIDVYCESGSTASCKVSGLPGGAKFNAKTMTISGAVSKIGAYTIKVTATNQSGNTMSQSFVLNVGHLKHLLVTAYTDYDTNGGKASGSGYYQPGKKLSLVATAAKGYVFAGWQGIDPGRVKGDVDLRTAKITYYTGDTDEEVFAYFVPAAEDANSLSVSIKTPLAVDYDETSHDADYEEFEGGLYAGVVTTQQVAVASLSLPKVSVSGLPVGLKFNASTYEIYGVPSRAGEYTVKVTASNLSGVSVTESFRVSVSALPRWAYGSYLGTGRLSTEGGDCDKSYYRGPMVLNVSKAGKLSGYYVFDGKRHSFARNGYTQRGARTTPTCPHCGETLRMSYSACSYQVNYCSYCDREIEEEEIVVKSSVYYIADVQVKVGSRIFSVPLMVSLGDCGGDSESGEADLGRVETDEDGVELLATGDCRDDYEEGYVSLWQTLVGRSDVATLPAKTLTRCFCPEDWESLGDGGWLTVRTYKTGKTIAAGRIDGNAVSWSSEFAPYSIDDSEISGSSWLYAAPVSRKGFIGSFLEYDLKVDLDEATISAESISGAYSD